MYVSESDQSSDISVILYWYNLTIYIKSNFSYPNKETCTICRYQECIELLPYLSTASGSSCATKKERKKLQVDHKELRIHNILLSLHTDVRKRIPNLIPRLELGQMQCIKKYSLQARYKDTSMVHMYVLSSCTMLMLRYTYIAALQPTNPYYILY